MEKLPFSGALTCCAALPMFSALGLAYAFLPELLSMHWSFLKRHPALQVISIHITQFMSLVVFCYLLASQSLSH